ncbi:hypothetical protein F1D05_36130 [Kribbella qitaiheensis]|uniref:Uncharacterized protein n=1 Tax=Kribbella qitaiheensis TaxID=1544730 RepID=A0A7G6X7X2_9ACTN|nr:hypothetical protein [Kribbella qitaiheensis]QNE22337.1 hypothetical protein F1D05_36130 [Kribbella qitaiheensis]
MSGPVISPQVPQNHREAKATAKAAKAYAKAQRPWFKKKRFIGLGLLAILVVIIVATNSSGSKTQSGTAPGAAATATKAAPPAAATGKALPIQNGDWRLDSIRIKDDGLGDFSGVARVTYTGDDSKGGSNLFTLTVFKSGKDVAALTGSANTVAPGTQVTVEFISSEKFVTGPYTYDFQNDL